jgi:SAM-dependent methyltransferase
MRFHFAWQASACTAAAIAVSAMAAPPPALVELDVPFVVSPPAVSTAMLEMANITSKDFVIDLGSGDGRIVILAASRYGAKGLGVEIDPALVERSRENAMKAKVSERAEFRVQDLFETDLARASIITMYLLPDVNLALRPKLLALKPGTRITSHDWDMGDWEADEVRVVDHPDKKLGLEKTSRVFRWTVPANINGRWCATEELPLTSPKQSARTITLDIDQRFQKLNGVLSSTVNMRGELHVRFRATMQGDRFSIPHSTTDAPAQADSATLTLDGRAYGLGSRVVFKPANPATATCAAPAKTVASQ